MAQWADNALKKINRVKIKDKHKLLCLILYNTEKIVYFAQPAL